MITGACVKFYIVALLGTVTLLVVFEVAEKESVFDGLVMVVLSLNTTVLLLNVGTGIDGITGKTTVEFVVCVVLADTAVVDGVVVAEIVVLAYDVFVTSAVVTFEEEVVFVAGVGVGLVVICDVGTVGWGKPPPGITLNQRVKTNLPDVIAVDWNNK